jgi:hypothetical protein
VHMNAAPRSRRSVPVPVHITYRRRDNEQDTRGGRCACIQTAPAVIIQACALRASPATFRYLCSFST